MKAAYQGVPGAYSEGAIIQHWDNMVEPLPKPSLEDVFSTVEEGEAEAGLVPIENTIEGSITRTYDLLKDSSLTILGEIFFHVSHCLIANPGVQIEDIKRVYSHPQALGQTRAFLAAHGYEAVNFFDTAGAVKMIREKGILDAAAVASRLAAEIYEMSILAEKIEDNSFNYTRFLQIGRGSTKPSGRDRTSLAFTIDNKPGTLVTALRILSDRSMNLSKIELRPYLGRPWEYVFFVDFDGHMEDPVSAEALSELATYTESLKILGSYPRA